MVFSSALFLSIFLPLFILLYECTPKKFKNYFILVASLAFFSWGAPKFVFVLVGVTILDFYLVKTMHESTTQKRKKLILILSLCMNVGMLLYFKYANFFIENVNLALQNAGAEKIQWTAIALPIGISFFTFQSLTYAVDVYRGEHKPLKSVINYLVFITNFPQMIAGPIVRYTAIADQIEERKETYDDKLQGFVRFCIGLGKKVFIANVLGQQADIIFSKDVASIGMMESWVGIAAYTFQIYFDFAGYSDMAIGLGRMMGFSFPENFDNPYTSKNITEFWRRWHMTLGSWMRDYLYIPLGGNRVSIQRIYFNLWFVFLISGLWHGASWNFVIWGAYHGLFLIIERLFLKKYLAKIPVFLQIAYNLLVVMIGWVFFRIEDFSTAIEFIGKMVDFSSINLGYDVGLNYLASFALAIFFSFITLSSLGKKWQQSAYFPTVISLKWVLLYGSIAIVFYWIALASIISQEFNPFIYFRF